MKRSHPTRRPSPTDSPLGELRTTAQAREPRWPALVAILAVTGLYAALPANLTMHPRWLLAVVVLVLLVPTVLSHQRGWADMNRICGHLVAGVITVGLIGSLAQLVRALPLHTEPPRRLLDSAAALWVSNILVFALWYWRLDAGGPHARDLRVGHTDGAFLFPQMLMDAESRREAGETNWTPIFMDYLFLAFNTSTAFSPADTSALSRWAKALMMIQASISLAVIALLAARAVNIL